MDATNAAKDCSSFKVCGADAKCAEGAPCAHGGGGGVAPAEAGMEPKRTHETDLLVFDVYPKSAAVPLDFLETQVRAVVLPHVSWCPTGFLRLENDPSTGVNRLRVSCLLKDSDETTVNRVEACLGALQYGNHACISSVAFRGYMAC